MSVKVMNLEHANLYTTGSRTKGESFEIWGAFYDVVPINENTPEEQAQLLNDTVSQAISSRVEIFCKLLDLTARQSSVEPWQEIDVALTALATLLEGKGLHGALEAIRPQVERVANLARRNGSSD